MNTPKLRFKEFKGSWSQVALENLAKIERGKFSIRPRNDPRYFGGTMPFVQTGDVTGSSTYLKGFSQTLNNEGVKVSKVFPSETILITIAANIGDTTITEYPVACPDSVVAIQPKKELADTIFLKNLIDLQKDFLDSQATQNAQKNINLQVLKPLPLIVPTKKEQTKIATFLSSVDDKIAQLSQKSDLLSQYKQGMMQKLFSQQIRFKADDGSEFGEWEVQKLEQLCSKKSSKITAKDIECDNGEYTVFGASGYLKSISHYTEDESYVAVVKDGAGAGRLFLMPQKSSVLGTLEILIPNSKIFLTFLFYRMNLIDFNAYIKGSTIPHVYFKDYSQESIFLPCLEEQTKIANFLSAIDQKIDTVNQQLEQAKQWKKGLLQQMFV